MTNLERALKLIGWQGGTIHQVNDAFNQALKDYNGLPDYCYNIDILTLDEFQLELIFSLYTNAILDKGNRK